MSWFSILPASISFIETWLIRIFLILGMMVIGPWLLLIIYDMILYFFRTATYEIPYVGGRARNRPRPRAPSLIPTAVESAEETVEGLKKRLERPGHARGDSKVISED
ncbi:homoserine dehydrogenase [Diplocarpon rosae]|nr:homoserine dehydrogenase [Diplocarpon rosae]